MCHKIYHGKRKPGVSDQTYFSFLSPAPFPNAHAHEEKYGWLARLHVCMVELEKIFLALVALKLLVLLISRLVACNARIVADKQTNKQTDTQNHYCNPRCACALRVNKYILYRQRGPVVRLSRLASARPISYNSDDGGKCGIPTNHPVFTGIIPLNKP